MSAPIVVGFDPSGANDAPVHFGIAAARFTGAPLIIAAIHGGKASLNRLGDGELSDELSADDLRQVARALGLVDIPEALMPRVLEHVRTHRRSMRKFDGSGLDLAGVVTAQPFRA